MGTGRPLAGPSTITFKRGCLLCLPLPSPALNAHSTSHTEARSQSKMSPFTKRSRDHILWHKISGATCPLPPGSSLAWDGSLTQALCDGPQQTAVCAAVRSSDAPGSQHENKGEAVLDKEYQRIGWWSVCFQTCPKASFDTKGEKKKNHKIK